MRDLWSDGADLLVTAEHGGVFLRHRDGTTRRVAGYHTAVAGLGQGEEVQLIAAMDDTISRLRAGVWETFAVELQVAPEGLVLAPSGEAIAWNGFRRSLVHVSPDNVVTRVALPPDLRPVQVLWSSAGEFVVVLKSRNGGAPLHVLMRVRQGMLVAHENDAALLSEAGCRSPDGAVLLSDGSLVLYQRRGLCHLPLAGAPTVMYRRGLFGEDFRDISMVRADGSRVVIVDSKGGVSSWQPGAPAATRLADSSSRSAGLLWVDPGSNMVAVFESSGPPRLVEAPLGHAPRQAGDGAWLASLTIDEDVQGETSSSSRGVTMILPVGRIGLGGVVTLSPDGPGGFAFDLVGGARLVFREGTHHPVLGAEFGYSRRGGSLDTNDLLLTVAAGYFSPLLGLQVAESVVFLLGDGRSGVGLRSALRVTTLFDTIGLEIGHGMEFDADRHELRFTVNLELAQLVMLGTLLRVANRVAH